MTDNAADELLQAHHLDPDVSLFSPETLQEVRDRLEYIEEHECDCGETPHESALHDLAHEDVPALLHVIERLTPRTITTPQDLDRVAARSVVRSAAGTIAARFDGRNGVVFGDDRPFPWHQLALPATVLWSPEAAR